ncbi:MAG: aminoacyl-tRNA hydrolase [Deltaproteobacteria bacterium]|nr:aminoacyl-tRNA hydrolase [Deltaproteobacteria bacterium]
MSWLVVGLGNPGAKYALNRHNIGFMVLDELARKHGLPAWSSKLGGEVTSGIVTTERGRERATLLKPMEFMNLSGFAVQRTAGFHKFEVDRVLVVHDEIDLPFGTLRLKNGGGHGGHNGLRSIQEQLGSAAFARLRVGVGRPPDGRSPAAPGGKPTPGSKDAAGWVLSDVPSAQGVIVTAMIAAGCEDIECVLAKGIVPAMNQHNARPPLAPS